MSAPPPPPRGEDDDVRRERGGDFGFGLHAAYEGVVSRAATARAKCRAHERRRRSAGRVCGETRRRGFARARRRRARAADVPRAAACRARWSTAETVAAAEMRSDA